MSERRDDWLALATDIVRRGELMQQTLARAEALQPVDVGSGRGRRFLSLPPGRVLRYPGNRDAGPVQPVLIVYSMINRPYLLDLQPRRSVVRRLTEAGFDVYVLDWGHPELADADLDLEECITGHIDTAVAAIRAEHRVDAVNLMGICQGGTFGACYAALHPERVRTLATLATPIDFHTPDNTLWRLVRDVDLDAVDAIPGNISSRALNAIFVGLKPLRLLDQRYFDMPRLCGSDEALADFLRMERWMYDSPDQPRAAFHSFARDFYQRNALCRGELRLGDSHVDLRRIDMPVFNAYATQDHLIPPAAAEALGREVSSRDYTDRAFPGGHLGLFVSGRAHRELYPDYVQWVRTRQPKPVHAPH